MKRFYLRIVLVVSLLAGAGLGQQAPESANPYQDTLDRLQALTTEPEAEWRFHADVPHPEDTALDDSTWPAMKVGEKWTTGARVLRRWIEIPANNHGYDLRGAKVKLD